MHRLAIARSVIKDMRKIPKSDIARITARIQALAAEPRPADAKKLRGSINLFRIRQGDYRIIYSIEDRIITVNVIKVGHRKDIYD